MNQNPNGDGRQQSSWVVVLAVIVLAIGIRLWRTADPLHYLLAGADGPYFPLQVRSLIEKGRLAFPDMPLLFAIAAAVTELLCLLHISSGPDAILHAIRITDAILPPLAAVPVFLLAKEIPDNSRPLKIFVYALTGFSVLSFTPLYIFSYQLQKNALATLWIFFFLYFAYRLLRFGKRSDAFQASCALILCAVTHFGSFTILLLMSMLVAICRVLFHRGKDWAGMMKKFTISLSIMALLALGMAMADPVRLHRLISIPLRLFESPVLLLAISGQNFLLHGYTLVMIIAYNLMALAGATVLFRKRAVMRQSDLVFGSAMAFCTLLMASPWLGLEWANRLYMLAYIPVCMLYLVVFPYRPVKWLRLAVATIFGFMVFFSLAAAIFSPQLYSINKASFTAFRQMGKDHVFAPGDAIVARQDLRGLASWEFRTTGCPSYLLTKQNFQAYPRVFFLVQSNGKSNALRETEPLVTGQVTRSYTNDFFTVDQLNDDANLDSVAGKPFRGLRGKIISITGHVIRVSAGTTGSIRTIILSEHTQVRYSGKTNNMRVGMEVEVNGSWRPFSINIDAETIKVLKDD